jgi:hypothetical protein
MIEGRGAGNRGSLLQLSFRVVKGGGLKIRCVMLRGFESHLNYHRLGKGGGQSFWWIFPSGPTTTAFMVRLSVRLIQRLEYLSY